MVLRSSQLSHSQLSNSQLSHDPPSQALAAESLPSRMRGERLDQPPMRSYSLSDGYLLVSLAVQHTDRIIALQVDVSPPLSPSFSSQQTAQPAIHRSRWEDGNKFLNEIRSKFEGFSTGMKQLFLGHRQIVSVEGPFLPESSSALTMTLQVARHANFDLVYDYIETKLATHLQNDDRVERFLDGWSSYEREGEMPLSILRELGRRHNFAWSEEELEYVESLQRDNDYPEVLSLPDDVVSRAVELSKSNFIDPLDNADVEMSEGENLPHTVPFSESGAHTRSWGDLLSPAAKVAKDTLMLISRRMRW